MLKIDHHSGVPAYRQLMDQIRFQIGAGILREGDELPSTRELSARLDLNPMTISKAFGLLQHEGTLERQKGKALRVRAVGGEASEANRHEQMRKALTPAVRAARQLGFTRKEAARVLRELFEEEKSPPPKT